MHSQRKSMVEVSILILPRLTNRPVRARPRRFLPLAERMETRAVPGALAFGEVIVPPAAIAIVGPQGDVGLTSALRALVPDEIEVNGQVEIDPGD